MRFWLFAAFGGLAVWWVAFAAPVQAPFSVTVIPAVTGIACAIGPTFTGTIPAAASAAGFTTCVANYDFTNTSSFTTNGQTYNFSQINTWLDCAGASSPLWWRDTFSYDTPCGSASMVNDGGTNALQLTLTPADVSAGYRVSTIRTSQDGTGNGTTTLPNGTTIPEQFYIEAKYRMATPDSNTGNGNLISDFWSVSATPNSAYMEFDFIEMYAGGGDAAGTNENLSFFPEVHHANSSLVPGYDHTQYHVFGERVTMSSSGSTAICFYVDGTQLQCTGPFTWQNVNDAQERLTILLWSGNANNSSQVLIGPLTANFEWIHVFACPNWNTGGASGGYACASSPITSNP